MWLLPFRVVKHVGVTGHCRISIIHVINAKHIALFFITIRHYYLSVNKILVIKYLTYLTKKRRTDSINNFIVNNMTVQGTHDSIRVSGLSFTCYKFNFKTPKLVEALYMYVHMSLMNLSVLT